VTTFLIDEMFPPAAAVILREEYGYDAVHVKEAGLQSVDDGQVAAVARKASRAVVTENVSDFAGEAELVLLFVRKKNLPAGAAHATALATVLDRWAHENPDPYLGAHWPGRSQTAHVHPRAQQHPTATACSC
jgi:hypothetical protein